MLNELAATSARTHFVEFTGRCWMYSGQGAWHFVNVPQELADQLVFFSRAAAGGRRPAGWGSVRVNACIGNTRWDTSMFPDSKTSSYLLPLKAAVRKAESIQAQHDVQVRLSVPMP